MRKNIYKCEENSIIYTVEEYLNGMKVWTLNGEVHRECGPAVEYANGTKYWYFHGKIHRLDGPAVIINNIKNYWYFYGKKVEGIENQHEFERYVKLQTIL